MDESTKDQILQQLLGEVDDHVGSKLPGGAPKKGVEVSIMITPHGDKPEEAEEGEHDPEGLCKGGCAHEEEPGYGDFLKKMGV